MRIAVFASAKIVEDFEKLRVDARLSARPRDEQRHRAAACRVHDRWLWPGRRVITAPFTFILVCVGYQRYVGATPVFRRYRDRHLQLSIQPRLRPPSRRAPRALSSSTSSANTARMDVIMAIAPARDNLFVIEDCAQAVGARYKDTPVGLLRDARHVQFLPTRTRRLW